MYNNDSRLRNPEALLQENLLMQIPSDPQKGEIVEILSKGPSVISYIGNLLHETQNQISMKKLLLEKNKREYDLRLSKRRLDTITKYKQDLQNHLMSELKEVRKLCEETGMTTTDAKAIVKSQRPEKPTAGDLKDIATYKEREFYLKEIYPLEEDVVILEKEYEGLRVKYKLYENNFKASQSIKGLIQNDEKNY